ncbi:MAG: GDP-L-fucose synthase [Bdellovibrionales bacterium]|nr:GDP-L-fucose synthase [Bdellovibrionales bacterium]
MALNTSSRIFVAGHKGLVGSAIVRNLKQKGYKNIIQRDRSQLDLMSATAVEKFFKEEKPDCVILAAAKVGGIYANNTYPADFIYDNLMIQNNTIHSAYNNACKKLVFLGSSCIYPKFAPQPIKEDYLLTGELEPTNAAYAIAKIAGIVACQSYKRQYGFNAISLMPTNLYGVGDNFALENSHVLPALMRRFHDAKIRGDAAVTVWGTGTPRREFLNVDDMADASVFLMETYDDEKIVNVGTGEDISIKELSEIVKEIVGFKGQLLFDTSKPDGTPRKLLDVSRINKLGWKAKIPLHEGIQTTYRWFLENKDHGARLNS